MMLINRLLALALTVAATIVAPHAFADDSTPAANPAEARLDIDGDGKLDLVLLRRDESGEHADLAIYFAIGNGKLDASRQPSFSRKDLSLDGQLLTFEGRGKGSLVIASGCGGCSNDFSTTLTIVYRHGEFLVAGVTYDWDTRNGIGSCDINFLTGKGRLSSGIPSEAKITPLKGRFKPIRLADWSGDKRPKACDF